MWRKLYFVARDFSRQVSQDNISAYAASTAFFVFLSMIPLMILICSILPYTPVTEAMFMRVVTRILPESVKGLAVALIGEVYDSSAGILSVALVMTVWTAAKGMLALMRGLNAVNGVVEHRNYFVLRFVACIYTVVMLAATLVSLTVLVFGRVIVFTTLRDYPALQFIAQVFLPFRYLLIWLVLSFVFALIYTYVPTGRDQRLRYQIPGALFSAVAWSGFSWGFSIYLDLFNFSMYGSLATIVIVMLWLYCCMYLFMIGANINKYLKPAIHFLYHRHRE